MSFFFFFPHVHHFVIYLSYLFMDEQLFLSIIFIIYFFPFFSIHQFTICLFPLFFGVFCSIGIGTKLTIIQELVNGIKCLKFVLVILFVGAFLASMWPGTY
jgi:hypothetical protein